jgi:hypothetical protein
MSRGGVRKGAGRKPGPFPKKYWMVRIRPEHAKFIAKIAKKHEMPIGDLVAMCVLHAVKQGAFDAR